MKAIIVALLTLTGATFSKADSSVEPHDYTFVVMSPTRACHGVQTLVGWKSTDKALDLSARFQVFDTSSGKLLWQMSKLLGTEGDVFLSDESDFVVVLYSRLWSQGYTGLHGAKVKDAPTAKQNAILNQPAAEFYRRGKLLSRHSLTDLGFSADGLELSVSNVYFYEPMSAKMMGHWDWPEADLARVTNPRFVTKEHLFRFFGSDGRERVFDYRSGKLLKSESAEEAAKRIDGLKRKESPTRRSSELPPADAAGSRSP